MACKKHMVREDSIEVRARNNKKWLNKEAFRRYFLIDSVLIQTPPQSRKEKKKCNYTPGELPASDL